MPFKRKNCNKIFLHSLYNRYLGNFFNFEYVHEMKYTETKKTYIISLTIEFHFFFIDEYITNQVEYLLRIENIIAFTRQKSILLSQNIKTSVKS